MKAAAGAFPKSLRLLSRREFRHVYDEGERRSGSLCTVFFRSNGTSQTRLGITAPSALGGAVVRNRIKRRLREVFRLNLHTLAGGWDVVLNPRAAVAKAPYANLEREILRLFPKQSPCGPKPQAPDRRPPSGDGSPRAPGDETRPR